MSMSTQEKTQVDVYQEETRVHVHQQRAWCKSDKFSVTMTTAEVKSISIIRCSQTKAN